jgi:ankyrin repeat protein
MGKVTVKEASLTGLTVTIFAALSLPPVARAQSEITKSSDLERATESVVALTTGAGERSFVGAGIVIGRVGDALIIVTAAHVIRTGVDEARTTTVRLKRFASTPLRAVRVVQVDRKLDLAVLRLEQLQAAGINACAVPVARLVIDMPVEREHAVFPVGNPAGVAWKVPPTADRVADVTAREVRFQSSVIESGHSGGALFNVFGDLVGMIRADEPPYGVAMRAGVLARTLADWKVAVGPGPCPDASPQANPTVAGLKTTAFRTWLSKSSASRSAFEERVRGDRAVLLAIYDNDLAALRRLVDAGARVQSRGEISPLQWAVMLGRTEALRYLLLKGVKLNEATQERVPGVEPNKAEEESYSALHMAARLDDAEAVSALTRAGADVDVGLYFVNSPGTPLTVAVAHGSARAAQALIRAGADVMVEKNGWDRDSRFPLGAAIERDDVAMIRMLQNAGAQLHTQYGMNGKVRLLSKAAELGKLNTLRYLIEQRLPLECTPTGCDSPMRQAVWANQIESIRVLVKAGANPTGGDFEPYLYLAVQMGHMEALRALLLGGANPNQAGRDGTPLKLARQRESKAMVDALLAYGAKH